MGDCVLITGGAGFIGSHVVEAFQGRTKIRVLDNLSSGALKNLDGFGFEFVQGSILDRKLLRGAMAGTKCVIHLAAMVSVPESVRKPAECHKINVTGTQLVLEEAARAKVTKLVFSSSAAVYGENPASPKTETLPPDPRSPYATSKLEGERLCEQFARESPLNTICLRFFNVFGPRQDPNSQYAAAVPAFVTRALRNEPITIYGYGDQTRDFVHVSHVAAAVAHFATQQTASGTYNIARGQAISIKELAQMIRRLTGSQSEIRYAAVRAGDVKHSVAAIDKLRAAGFEPATSLEQGLQSTIEFFKDGPKLTAQPGREPSRLATQPDTNGARD